MKARLGPRRKIELLAWLSLLALSASACARDEKVEAPKEPVLGGTLVIGTSDMGDHLNPAIGGQGSLIRSTMLIYQGLLSLDKDLNPEPELAESFEVEEDGKVYRFALRDGVKWHDGRPFTSEDVKFTFERVLLEFHPRTRSVLRTKLEAIETPSPLSVVFRLNEPFTVFPQLLTVGDAPILPKHIFESGDVETHPANLAPVGTGPFRFVSLTPESELRLARNADYFREGLPYLDSVVYRVIPEATTLLTALEKGEVDVILDFEEPTPDLNRREDDRFEVVATNADAATGNCTAFLGFNLDRAMFADALLRRAIAHGLDRNKMLEEIQFGYGRPADSPINSGISWAHSDDLDYPDFDRKKAATMLDDAGWLEGPDDRRLARNVPGVDEGTPLRFEILSSRDRAKMNESIKEQLSALGVEVVPTPVDSDLRSVRVHEQRDFDAYLTGPCQRTDPEIGLRRIIHSSGIVPIENTNGAGYKNPEVDDLMDQAAAEPDREVRADLYKRMQEILVRDMPYIWLLEGDQVNLRSRSCAGIEFDSVHLADRAYCAT